MLQTIVNALVICNSFVLVAMLHSRSKRTRQRLLVSMKSKPEGIHIFQMAEAAGCSNVRARIFLWRERLHHNIKLMPASQGFFVNTYYYKLNLRGRARYQA